MNADLVLLFATDNAALLLQLAALGVALWLGYLGFATDPGAAAAIDAMRARRRSPSPRRSSRIARRRAAAGGTD